MDVLLGNPTEATISEAGISSKHYLNSTAMQDSELYLLNFHCCRILSHVRLFDNVSRHSCTIFISIHANTPILSTLSSTIWSIWAKFPHLILQWPKLLLGETDSFHNNKVFSPNLLFQNQIWFFFVLVPLIIKIVAFWRGFSHCIYSNGKAALWSIQEKCSKSIKEVVVKDRERYLLNILCCWVLS